MSTPLRRRLRRLRRWIGYGVAALLILAGLVVALANQFLPVLARHPDRVAAWLGERIGRPVTLQHVDARWSRNGPLLGVRGLRIGSDDDVLELDQAELQINVYAGLLPQVPLTALRLRGPSLSLTRESDARWRLEGFGASRGGGEFDLSQLGRIGELQVDAATLEVHDVASGRRWSLPRIDARLRNQGDRLRFGAAAWIGDGEPLRIAADLDPQLQEGDVWMGGDGVEVAPWLTDTPLQGIVVARAHGRFDAWLSLSERRVRSLRLDTALDALALRGVVPVTLADGSEIEPRYGIDRLDASLLWQTTPAGWRLELAGFELDAGDAQMRAGPLRVTRDAGLDVEARDVELAPLLALAMLSDRTPPAFRRWLYLATPRASIERLALHRAEDGALRYSAGIRASAWQPAGAAPGVQGLAGTLEGDATALHLDVPRSALQVTAPGMLRETMTPTVSGQVQIFALAPGWRVESDSLEVRGEDYAFDAAGGIELQGDGSRPLLDLRAVVHAGPITAAKKFWILNRMPAASVRWLDDALVDGQLAHGQILVRGDGDDWPFLHGEGRLEAEADLLDTRLRYRPDWPIGEAVSGRARFINQSMLVDLSGRVHGNTLRRVSGSLDSFKQPVLELEVEGDGSGEDLLGLLRASPLQHRYGAYLTGLDVGGRGDARLRMTIPLKRELGDVRLDGRIDLSRADLADAKWNLAFGAATGRVRFTHRGFSADELAVDFGGGLAALSIAVGDFTSGDDNLAEASLRGRIAADALLEPYAGLHWLLPHLEGQSDWSLQLAVPRADAAEAPRRLRVRSDLVGTELSLPAPLRKGRDERLALDLALALPLDQGEIELRLGELMHLRGRMPTDAGFTGLVRFGDVPDATAPAQGIVAIGQVPVLDVGGWSALALSAEGSGTGLQRADLFAGELDVLDRAFPETRLTFHRAEDATLALGFEGTTLQGTVRIPVAELATRGITARFERLHWPAQTPKASGTPAFSANPAVVPSLHLQIDDFRFGAAALGQARLETYPTPEGMHVERFEADSEQLSLRARGDWTRIEGRERSNFRLDFTAADLGSMLAALGFSKLVEGGDTIAALQATWPGPPSAFELERVDGTLTARVGKGRVLEVDPGAGRLFGLLSLTEIPRRLALDFSDFFKSGLAFNEISGTFALDAGNAHTQDLRIDGPAAEIRIRGRTGLKSKDYDQTMEVLPRAGSVLPALGALAGGPAGAAIGAVAQAVLQQPIKQMARTLYRVQGSWSEPAIDVIERGPQDGSNGGTGGNGGRAGR